MRLYKLVLLLCLASFWLACSKSGISVRHDFDPNADFSNLKTFNWMELPKEIPQRTQEVLDRAPDLHMLIKTAVENRLRNKGYEMRSPDGDFLVAYHLLLQAKEFVDVSQPYNNVSYGRLLRTAVKKSTFKKTFEEGTLIIDFVDPETREIIWRGSATKMVDRQSSPEKRDKNVGEGVKQILKKFPDNKNK